MKRTSIAVLMALMLLVCAHALAYDEAAYGAENTPQEILDFIAGSRWSGWEVTGWVNPETYKLDSAQAFVAVKNGKTNDLLAFRRDYDANTWVYAWHNAAALPQTEEPIKLGMYGDGGGSPRFKSCYVVNGELEEAACFWEQEKNGTWNLQEMIVYDLPALMFMDTSKAGVMHMTNAGWVEGPETDVTIYGVYQRDLRYFSFSAFPTTVEEAKEKLSNPPKIPGGTLSAKEIHFTSGQKYAVYQGPGEEYRQAANGKALVSTNDWIQVFGEENGYIMIQYDISSDRMRIGWIEASALPRGADVNELVYEPVEAYTTEDVELTDDPLNSRTAVVKLGKDTGVTWLAAMGDWAYVECRADGPIRGFVPSDALAAYTEMK